MTAVAPLGKNMTRLWGLSAEERLRRIARAQGLEVRADGKVLVDLGYAFDPAWLRLVADRPGPTVTRDGVAVLTHRSRGPSEIVAWEESGDLENEALRKKERPFMERLAPDTERSACGVTVADAGWPKVPELGQAVEPTPGETEKLVAYFRQAWRRR
ncbi:MAG: hypothetical protein QOJ27_754 [Sphingomonadales bacterium]|nr:hypothetical protein [Sphingomonadales bacterium]